MDGAALRSARKARGWSVDELSLMSGLPVSSLRRWESGRTGRAQINFLAIAARALQVDVKTLIVEPERLTLRDYRYRAGLTVHEAADRVGCSLTLISNAETGLRLSDSLVGQLAGIYGAAVPDLRQAFQRKREARIHRIQSRSD